MLKKRQESLSGQSDIVVKKNKYMENKKTLETQKKTMNHFRDWS